MSSSSTEAKSASSEARTRGFFFERRPGYGLLTAFLCATFTSTLLAVYWPMGSAPAADGAAPTVQKDGTVTISRCIILPAESSG